MLHVIELGEAADDVAEGRMVGDVAGDVSPWISTWTRAADSRPRNSLPLRAAIPGTVPSVHGRSSRFAGSLAARVTYLLEPKNWLIVTVAAVTWRLAGAAGVAYTVLVWLTPR